MSPLQAKEAFSSDQFTALDQIEKILQALKPRDGGLITGNGAGLSYAGAVTWGGWQALTYKPTMDVIVDLVQKYHAQSIVAAWTVCYAGFAITPTPPSRLHANAQQGVAPAGPAVCGRQWTHNAGPVSVHVNGWDRATLKGGVEYTITAMFAENVNASNVWANGVAENHLLINPVAIV